MYEKKIRSDIQQLNIYRVYECMFWIAGICAEPVIKQSENNKKFSQLRSMKQWEFKLETSLELGLHLDWVLEDLKYHSMEENFIW